MAVNRWYESVKDLTDFLNVLIDSEVITDTDDVQSFLNKPRAYNDMYTAWDNAGSPTSEDAEWDSFVDSISEDEGEEE